MPLHRYLVIFAAAGILCSTGAGLETTPPKRLVLTVGKSLSVDSPLVIQRVAMANEALAETVVIGPKELLINAKAPGETSLVIWQEGDIRLVYDLLIRPSSLKLEAAREQIAREFPGASIDVSFDNDTAFLRGTVKDGISSDRVVAIAATLGKTVNLLRVTIPPVEPQILLKVRFANIDRAAGRDLGLSLATGAFNQTSSLGTGQPISTDVSKGFTLSQAINIFLFRKDLNLGVALQALESKRLLEMLAEPNLLVINGTAAHFVAGGEFPYPMVQPGAGSSSITIAFKEYGIRLGFLPVITPRGAIRLQVAPEVSALDYTNSVTIAGTTVPGTSTRKVQTEVELESGQTFVIAGLLDNQITETLSKIPGISNIPVLGKLFQSRSTSHSHTELLIMITPEIVRPIPADQATPELKFSMQGLSPAGGVLLRQPGLDITGPAPVLPTGDTMPIELLTAPASKKLDAAPSRPSSPSGGAQSSSGGGAGW